MKLLLSLALLGFTLTSCNIGAANKTKNANSTSAPLTLKDRFLGTWEAASGGDSDGGPITFKRDNTYSAQKTKDINSGVSTGTYELRGERLYCLGPLETDTKDGFKVDGDQLSLTNHGRTVLFSKR